MSGKDTGRLPRSLPIAAIASFGVLYGIGSLLGWAGSAFTAWAEVAAAAVATASVCYAARRPAREAGADPGGRRDTWRWFGIAATCWLIGAVSNAISSAVLSRSAVSLSIADLFYLAAMVALAVGFVVPVKLPRAAGGWLRFAADTYVCVAALFVLGWVAQFSRLYDLSDETPAEFVLELLYPLVDVALVCATLPFVLGAARRYRRSTTLAYLALIAFASADIVTTVVRLRGGNPAADPGDIARIAGLLLLSAATWMDARAASAAPADQRGRMIGPGLAVAAVAAAAAAFVAGHSLTSSNGVEPVVTGVAGSATIVLLARLAGLLRENERLRGAVHAGEEHFRALAESINDAVLICDLDATVQYVGAGAQRTFRYRPEELLGRSLQEVIHPEDLPRVDAAFTRFGEFRSRERTLRVPCRIRAADGTWLPTESTLSRYAGPGDARVLVTARDLSEQAALQRQVTHLTFHDGLTGLPNRAYFEERTREVLACLPRSGRVAVLFADLDGFTAVNDSAGHAAGDQVLAQAARRLRGTFQVEDTVARWGGDEYAVLVQIPAETPGASGGESQIAVELAERLLRVLSAEPYRVGTKSTALTASVGIAFAEDRPAGEPGDRPGPEPCADPGADQGADQGARQSAAELIRNADLAMARAKELGGGRVEVFAAHMHADAVRRLELGSDLRRALEEEQFAVEFQPVVELATSRVTGVEALVRWWRGSRSVPPEDFIGPAEESGLMVPLGDWVLREACREVAGWREESWDIGLSVNFTARQIAAPRFVESVAAALDETGLPPSALTLEVKEEVLVEDAGQNVERLSALRELGVRLAIDDFGTGYASLAYLGQLPVDIIKIDPSFVAGLSRDETRTLLTRTIVRLGRDLGLIVVAEGIERPEQLDLLREMGCPRGQGFLVARPMAARRVESLVRTNLALPPGHASGGFPLPESALSAG